MPDINSQYAEDINNAQNRQPQRTKTAATQPAKDIQRKIKINLF